MSLRFRVGILHTNFKFFLCNVISLFSPPFWVLLTLRYFYRPFFHKVLFLYTCYNSLQYKLVYCVLIYTYDVNQSQSLFVQWLLEPFFTKPFYYLCLRSSMTWPHYLLSLDPVTHVCWERTDISLFLSYHRLSSRSLLSRLINKKIVETFLVVVIVRSSLKVVECTW